MGAYGAKGGLPFVNKPGDVGRHGPLHHFIHPEAIFVLHGFGYRLPVKSRASGKGLADYMFMKGGLSIWDQAGGAIAYQEHFVKVEKA